MIRAVRGVIRKAYNFAGVQSASLATLQKLSWEGIKKSALFCQTLTWHLSDPLLLAQQLTDEEKMIHVFDYFTVKQYNWLFRLGIC